MTAPIGPSQGIVSPLERGEGGVALPGAVPGASFGDLFVRALNDASGLQEDARAIIGAYLRGEPVELHQVMAASEEAAIALELLVEVRNKLADAYRTIMNMQ
ncbi:MAG TPA: flagellar hook-basal body complex protein FliE [Gemmatimonadales bacterium]|jgi:flagellar hook-basal body complex protein FliE|nr:flagellar hook-basal body complex protein FliE [Gemmatimonadales bacterium]